MKATSAGLAAFVLLLAAWAGAFAAAPSSDAQRLRDGLPPGFRRTVVHVYPVIDSRPLGAETPSAAGSAFFEAFLTELGQFANLDLRLPARTLARIKARPAFQVQEQFARSKAEEGLEDYRQVRLDAAAQHLREATELFQKLEYVHLDPRFVGRAELTRGLALLERGDSVDANAAFTQALQADARLRLREKFDRPESVAAFERARTTLLSDLPAPEHFAEWPGAEPPATDVYVLRARLLPADAGRPERLEVILIATGGVQPDVQAVAAPEAASRLATRVWASLPFGRAQKEKGDGREIRLDAGFAWFLFGQNALGTGIFNNVGAQSSFSFSVARNVGLQATFTVANSGRDTEEDLRADIVTYRGFVGPGYETRIGAWRFDAHVGVEAASPGRVVTTDNVYCKFDPEGTAASESGAEGTQPSIFAAPCGDDISSTGRTLLIGAALTAGASYDLVDQLYLSLALNAAEYLYEMSEADLGRPIGASLSLGYRFR